MDHKSIEWHEYKLDIYKRRGMTASIVLEEMAIEGIKAKSKRLKTKKNSGI